MALRVACLEKAVRARARPSEARRSLAPRHRGRALHHDVIEAMTVSMRALNVVHRGAESLHGHGVVPFSGKSMPRRSAGPRPLSVAARVPRAVRDLGEREMESTPASDSASGFALSLGKPIGAEDVAVQPEEPSMRHAAGPPSLSTSATPSHRARCRRDAITHGSTTASTPHAAVYDARPPLGLGQLRRGVRDKRLLRNVVEVRSNP